MDIPYKKERSADDYLLIYFTSGTTGMPKMVTLPQRYTLGHIVTARYWLNCMDDGLHFTLAETGWAKASWGKLFGQWLCGSAIFAYDFHGKFDPSALMEHIARYKITTFCAPPTVYRFMIKSDMSKYDLSSVKYMMTAGEALNPEIYRQIRIKTGHPIYEGFGQTETTVVCGTSLSLWKYVPARWAGLPPVLCTAFERTRENRSNRVKRARSASACATNRTGCSSDTTTTPH